MKDQDHTQNLTGFGADGVGRVLSPGSFPSTLKIMWDLDFLPNKSVDWCVYARPMKHLLLLGLLSACSRCSEAPELAEAEPEVEAEAETGTEVVAPEVAALAEADTPTPSPPTAETLQEARAAIREGRKKAGADDFEGALAEFDRALELIPTAARVRCEAGFLAHRAGDHARAARQIDLALLSMPQGASVPDAWKVPLAMCLYNRGLVGEAIPEEEDEWDVLELYRESLELRENTTVRARMNALEGRLGDGITPAAGSLQQVIQIVGDVCKHEPNCTEANYSSDVQNSSDEEDERPCWERRVERNQELGDDRAVVLEVASTECVYDVSSRYLALEGQEEWTAYLLGSTSVANTDSFHREESDDSDRVDISRVDSNLVRINYTNIRESHYGSEDDDEHDDEEDAEPCYVDNYTRAVTHTLLLCRQDRPHVECGTIELGSAHGTSWDSSCGGGEEFPPRLEDIDASLARRIRFEDGFVIVEPTAAAPASYDGPEPGRYSLDTFFTDILASMRPEST